MMAWAKVLTEENTVLGLEMGSKWVWREERGTREKKRREKRDVRFERERERIKT